MGRDFLIKGHSVRKPKVPVEEEGKWERQRGSCPIGSEARSQAHICGGRTGELGSPTGAHQDHSPFTTHTHRHSSYTHLDTQASTHPALETQEVGFKEKGVRNSAKPCREGMSREGRREEGGRSRKAQRKSATERWSLEGGRQNRPEGGKTFHGRDEGKTALALRPGEDQRGEKLWERLQGFRAAP